MRFSRSRHCASSAYAAPASALSAAAARASRQRGGGRGKCFPFSRMTVMADLSTAPVARAPAALIDIGINLAHDSYEADRDAVLARAAQAGVVQLIVTGSSLASSRGA